MVQKEENEMLGYSVEDIIKTIMKKYKHEIGYSRFEENKGITVEALCYYCMDEIAKGNGQKHIQISMDDEGNGFHTLFYGFSSDDLGSYDYHDKVDKKKIILLG